MDTCDSLSEGLKKLLSQKDFRPAKSLTGVLEVQLIEREFRMVPNESNVDSNLHKSNASTTNNIIFSDDNIDHIVDNIVDNEFNTGNSTPQNNANTNQNALNDNTTQTEKTNETENKVVTNNDNNNNNNNNNNDNSNIIP